MKQRSTLMILSLLVLLLGGCFLNDPVKPGTVMLIRQQGADITSIERTGKHSRFGFWATNDLINVSAQTITWADPELITSDPQPIGYELTITYRRMSDNESIEAMYQQYHAEAVNDEALANLVRARIPGVAKDVTAEFSLDQQLGVGVGSEAGRTAVVNRLEELLAPELADFHVDLINVSINNIAPSQEYVNLLEAKANAREAQSVAAEQDRQYQAQLEAEKALTEIEIEQARRANLVNQELARTYDVSDRAYELERLRLMADLFGEGDKVWFIPQGTDLTLLLSEQGGVPASPFPLGGD